jgi:tryptophan-rich sensory protein
MKRLNKIIQIIWLAVAAVAAVEGYIAYQKAGGFNQRVYLMIGAFVVAIAMYTLRKRQGKSIK